jgi:RimJ/RimL family protein N-acetyltransferase
LQGTFVTVRRATSRPMLMFQHQERSEADVMCAVNALPAGSFDPWATADVFEGTLVDSTPIVVLPVGPGCDEHELLRGELVEGFEELSAESRYRRFMVGTTYLSSAMLHRLVDTVDDVSHVVLVARLLPSDAPRVTGESAPVGAAIGVGRFFRCRDNPSVAEVAVTVVDAWQGRGVGRLLLRSLADAAMRRGITTFVAEVLAINAASLALLAHVGKVVRSPTIRGVAHVEVVLDSAAATHLPRPAQFPKVPRAKEILGSGA